ncbi:MAG: hypothetical protein MUO60_17230, partial [Clostridiaceae bacterium]|nr:hypothetical protein [Clostridiaceae bacterium]
ANVAAYSNGKNIIKEETMGNLKTTTIYQNRDSKDKEVIKKLGLEIASVRLQELIIGLTNS